MKTPSDKIAILFGWFVHLFDSKHIPSSYGYVGYFIKEVKYVVNYQFFFLVGDIKYEQDEMVEDNETLKGLPEESLIRSLLKYKNSLSAIFQSV